MKTLKEMGMGDLLRELQSRKEAAYYEEIACPITKEDYAHNKSIVDGIEEIEIEISRRTSK